MKRACLLLIVLAGCRAERIGFPDRETWKDTPIDPQMEAFIKEAVAKSGVELKEIDQDDPKKHAWDDVPLDQLPDNQRAEKVYQRAQWLTAEVKVGQDKLWNVGYREFGGEWMLDNISTAIINPKTEILYTSQGKEELEDVKAHPIFKHFIPPKHAEARKACDAVKKRARGGP